MVPSNRWCTLFHLHRTSGHPGDRCHQTCPHISWSTFAKNWSGCCGPRWPKKNGAADFVAQVDTFHLQVGMSVITGVLLALGICGEVQCHSAVQTCSQDQLSYTYVDTILQDGLGRHTYVLVNDCTTDVFSRVAFWKHMGDHYHEFFREFFEQWTRGPGLRENLWNRFQGDFKEYRSNQGKLFSEIAFTTSECSRLYKGFLQQFSLKHEQGKIYYLEHGGRSQSAKDQPLMIPASPIPAVLDEDSDGSENEDS